MHSSFEAPGSAIEEGLVSAMASGDKDAALRLVRLLQPQLFGLAISMVGDRSLAEEIAQEAMVRVWRHAAIFDPRKASVRVWALSITRNLAIDALRVRRSEPVDPERFTHIVAFGAELGPEAQAITSVQIQAMRVAMGRLPLEQRRALIAAAIFGRTAAEIAEAEGIPLGTAKTRIRTAMEKLRVLLAEEDECNA
ncbi:MAG: RNA polymerase sigma factor [Acidimicrobiales bacterium]